MCKPQSRASASGFVCSAHLMKEKAVTQGSPKLEAVLMRLYSYYKKCLPNHYLHGVCLMRSDDTRQTC